MLSFDELYKKTSWVIPAFYHSSSINSYMFSLWKFQEL